MWSLACSCDAPKRPGVKPGGNIRKRSRISTVVGKTCSSLNTSKDKGTLSSNSDILSTQLLKEPGPRPWPVSSTESHYVGLSNFSLVQVNLILDYVDQVSPV